MFVSPIPTCSPISSVETTQLFLQLFSNRACLKIGQYPNTHNSHLIVNSIQTYSNQNGGYPMFRQFEHLILGFPNLDPWQFCWSYSESRAACRVTSALSCHDRNVSPRDRVWGVTLTPHSVPCLDHLSSVPKL